MPLADIRIAHCRNLTEITIPAEQSPWTYLTGPNGTGKTSILEGIHFLSTGRSFRTNKLATVIQEGADELSVYAKYWKGSQPHDLGIRKSLTPGRNKVLLDGDRARQSDLAHLIPIQWINPDSFRLLLGEPEYRRRFMDWAMFHVEHSFHEHWKSFEQALKQRNRALQVGNVAQIRSWDEVFVSASQALHSLRMNYAEWFLAALNPLIYQDLPEYQPELTYIQGWDTSSSLHDALQNALPLDLKRGYTSVGPHRADFKLHVSGVSIKDRLSRGQLKRFLLSMHIAQHDLVYAQAGKKAVFLIDDMPSELDHENQHKLLSRLKERDLQAFITGIEVSFWDAHRSIWGDQGQMFHVEQLVQNKSRVSSA